VAPAPEPAPSPALEPISSPEPEPVPSPEPEIKPEELPAEPSAELPPVAEPEIKAEELLVEPPTELQLTEPEPMPGVNGAQAFETEDSGEGTPSPVAQVPEPATEVATSVIESADVTPTEVVAPAEVIAPTEVAAPSAPAEPTQPDDSLLAETRMPEPTLPPETTEGPVASAIETEAAVETIPVTETVTADETAAVVEAEAPIEVRRARRTDMDALGIALAKVENRPEPLQRAELLKRAGERGYRIAVSGDSIIALAAWQAENLVAVTREVWAESARAGERALPPLFGLIEHDASELQCEASIVLVNPLTPEFVLDLIRSSNYQLRPVTTLNRIWRQIAEERAQPGDSVWVKRLREDLVTKPI
jgi:hypothetical protein